MTADQPMPSQRKRWRKMEQLERSLDNEDIWTAKLETAKKYLKKWQATTKRLKAELERDSVVDGTDKYNDDFEEEMRKRSE